METPNETYAPGKEANMSRLEHSVHREIGHIRVIKIKMLAVLVQSLESEG